MPNWEALARAEIAAVLQSFPPDIASHAEGVPVFLDETPFGDDPDDDLLGLFEGMSLRDGTPAEPADLPRITLFTSRLAEYADGDDQEFRHEVRTTYLHEIGHYLGWDEDEVEARGLA